MFCTRNTIGLAILMFSLFATMSCATTYSISVPLTGSYTQGAAYQTYYCDLDFGRHFASIDTAYNSTRVSITGYASMPEDIYGNTKGTVEWGVVIGDTPVPGTTYSNWKSGSFSCDCGPAWSPSYWNPNDLLDGRTRAALRVAPCWDSGCYPGWVSFSSITLRINATEAPVPEPATCLALVSGCVWTALLCRRRR